MAGHMVCNHEIWIRFPMSPQDNLKTQELNLAKSFYDFAKSGTGGYLENKSVIRALKILRSDVFDLSYKEVYDTGKITEKILCNSLSKTVPGYKWDSNSEVCITEGIII